MSSKSGLSKELTHIVLVGVGLTSIASVIFVASPYIVIGGWRPFDNYIIRSVAVLLLCATVGGVAGWQFWKRKKSEGALAEGISEGEEQEDNSETLAERIKDAIATLKKASGRKSTFLYELPWYLLIGPPGSGKTTALVNSGLKFPLSAGATPAALAGVGGTRYCDWWFTEDAILIDTAGRYTTQDSDASADKKSWFAFLDLLKTNRPRQPINGVLVFISLEDILQLGSAELAAHSGAVRARLLELQERLKVAFPVYAVFTKGDLIAGFADYFGNLDEQGRRQVWGATFQTADKSRNLVGDMPREFEALIERLNQDLPDRLQEEPAPSTRISLYGFPAQMATLKRPLHNFLNAIFEPTRYHSNANLRGFYFTSGIQHGAPIDQLINALVKNFGAQEVAGALYSGAGKSFFLFDLIEKVIIGEAAWVSTDARALRAALALKAAAFALILAAAAAAGGLWLSSYWRNEALVVTVDNTAKEYAANSSYPPLAREETVSDRDFAKVLPLLQKLRYAPTGYPASEAASWMEGFGLSQRQRLASASQSAYRQGLEQLLRPRLLYRLEEVLFSRRNEPDYIYEALKVYMMLGGLHAVDRNAVLAWERRDWTDELYQGAGPQEEGRRALEEHLSALLDLESERPPSVEASTGIVEESQKALASLSLAQRAYQLLKKASATSLHIPDWTAPHAGGVEFDRVFENAAGGDSDAIRVPGFYTYAGFHKAFLPGLPGIAERVNAERWVLGRFAQDSPIADQYTTLASDLYDLYAKDFVASWRSALAKLRIKRLTGDRPRYAVLGAAAAAASPIKGLFESVCDETMLTKTRATPAKDGAQGAEQEAAAQKGAEGANLFTDRDQAPGSKIEAQFRRYHEWVENGGSHKPIEELLGELSEIKDNLIASTTAGVDAGQANANLATRVQKLKSTASRLPDPFKDMMLAAAVAFDKDINNAELERLSRGLGDQVIGVCERLAPGRYPFARNSSSEIALSEFGRLFGQNGVMDGFFKQNLQKYADLSKKDWSWRTDIPLAKSLSNATLKEFQRAAQIRDAFFANGGAEPAINLQVVPPLLSGEGVSVKFEINGATILAQSGTSVAPQAVQWPGPAAGSRAIVSLLSTAVVGAAPTPTFPPSDGAQPQQAGQPTPPTVVASIGKTGTWALFRLLDNARATKSGDRLIVSFVLGGRELQYTFTVNSALNPFTLPALREFHCPTSM